MLGGGDGIDVEKVQVSGQLVIGVLAYSLAINILGYAAMVLDKAKAENRSRRIPEATLLNLACLGGSVGTVLTQQTIRSKLVGIIVLQVLLLIALLATGSPEALWHLLTS